MVILSIRVRVRVIVPKKNATWLCLANKQRYYFRMIAPTCVGTHKNMKYFKRILGDFMCDTSNLIIVLVQILSNPKRCFDHCYETYKSFLTQSSVRPYQITLT